MNKILQTVKQENYSLPEAQDRSKTGEPFLCKSVTRHQILQKLNQTTQHGDPPCPVMRI